MHMRDCADFTVLIDPAYFVVSGEKRKNFKSIYSPHWDNFKSIYSGC